MLVLNRRPGESIIIEPDIRATVLSVGDGRAWIGFHAPGILPDLRLTATVVSPEEARLEIGPLVSLEFGGDGVHMQSAPPSHPAAEMQAGISLCRGVGQRIDIDDGLWLEVGSLPKGNPSIAFGGLDVGEPFTIAIIRPAGSYVRIGVEAPGRRVYREELWETVRESALDADAAPAEEQKTDDVEVSVGAGMQVPVEGDAQLPMPAPAQGDRKSDRAPDLDGVAPVDLGTVTTAPTPAEPVAG